MGVSVAFVLAQLIGWPLAHVAPALAGLLLADPTPPSLAGARSILGAAFMAMLANFLISIFLLPYLPVMILVIALVLYRFYIFIQLSGAPTLAVIGALIGSIVIPVLVHQQPEVAVIAGFGLLIDFAVAILVSWIGFALIPTPDSSPEAEHALPSLEEATSTAATLALVVTPFFAAFLIFGWTKILVLGYAAYFATAMSTTGGLEQGWGKVAANLVFAGGGMLFVYEAFVMVPSIPFMIASVFGACLFYGLRIFGGGPSAQSWSSGFLGFLILLGGALLSGDVVTPAKLIDRVIQIGLATAYVALAFGVVDVVRSAAARLRAGPPLRGATAAD